MLEIKEVQMLVPRCTSGNTTSNLPNEGSFKQTGAVVRRDGQIPVVVDVIHLISHGCKRRFRIADDDMHYVRWGWALELEAIDHRARVLFATTLAKGT